MKFTNEQEIIDALERQALLINQKLSQGTFSIEEINKAMPDGMINLNDTKDHQITYTGERTEGMLGVSQEELLGNHKFYVKELIYPGDYEKAVHLTENYLLGGPKQATIKYIQRVRPLKKAEYSTLYTLVRLIEYKNTITTASIVIPMNDLGKVSNKMVRILEETIYMRNNYHKFASLTTREKEIITLLALGYQNNEIADRLFISKATVEQHRKNFKRKLDIKRFADLMRFAQAFDLI